MSLTTGIDASQAKRWFLKEIMGDKFEFSIIVIINNRDANEADHSVTDVTERRLRREIGKVKQCI